MREPAYDPKYGFRFGPATVTRLVSHPKHGVYIEVAGARESVDVRVTPSGQIRVLKVRKIK